MVALTASCRYSRRRWAASARLKRCSGSGISISRRATRGAIRRRKSYETSRAAAPYRRRGGDIGGRGRRHGWPSSFRSIARRSLSRRPRATVDRNNRGQSDTRATVDRNNRGQSAASARRSTNPLPTHRPSGSKSRTLARAVCAAATARFQARAPHVLALRLRQTIASPIIALCENIKLAPWGAHNSIS